MPYFMIYHVITNNMCETLLTISKATDGCNSLLQPSKLLFHHDVRTQSRYKFQGWVLNFFKMIKMVNQKEQD